MVKNHANERCGSSGLNKIICPFRALMALSAIYPMSAHNSAFQVKTQLGWQPLTDTRVRKCLTSINMTLGLNPHYYTFHSFRRSAATLRIMSVFQFNTSNAMVLGPATVSGAIYSQTTRRGSTGFFYC